jgi:hypothetical protein
MFLVTDFIILKQYMHFLKIFTPTEDLTSDNGASLLIWGNTLRNS